MTVVVIHPQIFLGILVERFAREPRELTELREGDVGVGWQRTLLQKFFMGTGPI